MSDTCILPRGSFLARIGTYYPSPKDEHITRCNHHCKALIHDSVRKDGVPPKMQAPALRDAMLCVGRVVPKKVDAANVILISDAAV